MSARSEPGLRAPQPRTNDNTVSARSEPGWRAPRPRTAPPSRRDRVVDALRAYAIGGVVLGHWLVTALVLTADGSLHTASPLAALPILAPATWLLQTLGLFFFTAGYAATRSLAGYPHGAGRWLARRLGRLLRPALALVGIGSGLLLAAIVLGAPEDTLTVAVTLAWATYPVMRSLGLPLANSGRMLTRPLASFSIAPPNPLIWAVTRLARSASASTARWRSLSRAMTETQTTAISGSTSRTASPRTEMTGSVGIFCSAQHLRAPPGRFRRRPGARRS